MQPKDAAASTQALIVFGPFPPQFCFQSGIPLPLASRSLHVSPALPFKGQQDGSALCAGLFLVPFSKVISLQSYGPLPSLSNPSLQTLLLFS